MDLAPRGGAHVLAAVALAGAVVAASALAAPPAGASGGFPDAGTVVVTGLSRPEAMTLAPGGTRWVADTFANRVVRVDLGSTTGVPVTGTQIGPYPGGVAVDAAGRLYVADTFNHRVLRFEPGSTTGVVVAGGPGTGAGNAGPGPDRLDTPTKLEVDAAGRLLVVDTANDRVVRFATGSLTGTVVAGGSRGSGPGQLTLPVGLALDASGALYVADTQNHRVVRWAPGATSGTVVAGTGSAGPGPGQLRGPAGVDVTPDGALLVADTQNHRVVRWAPGATAGELVAGGTEGPALTQLDLPADVTAEGTGAFSVVDRDNGRVLRFARPGTHVVVLPAPEFRPLMAALAASGALAVAPVTPTTFEVPGCGSGTSPLPARSPADFTALLAGDGYLSLTGPAGPLAEACRPSAVTVTRSP